MEGNQSSEELYFIKRKNKIMQKMCEDKAKDYLAKTLNKALKLSSNKDHPHY